MFKIYDEPFGKIGEHASDILNMVNRYRQIRRHVQNIW